MSQQISLLGLDIATRVFRGGIEDSGRVVLRKRIARHAWRRFLGHAPSLRKSA